MKWVPVLPVGQYHDDAYLWNLDYDSASSVENLVATGTAVGNGPNTAADVELGAQVPLNNLGAAETCNEIKEDA